MTTNDDRSLFFHEKSPSHEEWFYISRDETGDAVVEREWDDCRTGRNRSGSQVMSVKKFFASRSGEAQRKLVQLMGARLA
jgi:hypothetical protein